MMVDRRGIPLRPDWPAAGDVLVRACAAHLLAHRRERDPVATAQKAWPRDSAVAEIIKAAVSPASLTGASALAQSAVQDFFLSLSPASAAASVLARAGLQLSFDSYASVRIPAAAADAGNAAFIREGAGFPVRGLTLDGPTLTPIKLGVICVFTNEILARSVVDIEGVVRTLLAESAALALDTYLFDDTEGDDTRPAGLRFGISAITAAGAPPFDAPYIDTANLLAAVGAVAGNGPVLLVAAPRQAARLRLMTTGPSPGFEIFSSSTLADGVVLAVAPGALASAIDARPEFIVSNETTLHEDSVPLPIVTGSPATLANPTRALFQTDCSALRLRVFCLWGLRSPLGLAWTTANW